MSSERGNAKLKWLDRFVGIPLAWLLGAARTLRRAGRLPSIPNLRGARVVVLAPAAIGDTILASGLIQDLDAAGALVTIVTSQANAGVVPLLPGIHAHVTVPITKPLRALRILRSLDIDILVDITPWPRLNAVLAALCGARITVGFRTEGQHRHWPFDLQVQHRHDVHQSENCAQLGAALGLRLPSKPRLSLPELMSVPALPELFVAFHAWPGGHSSKYKEWPESYWVDLGRRVVASGNTLLLTGGKADCARSAKLEAALVAQGLPVVNATGKANLAQTAAILARAQLVVSVDTGVLHLAGALDLPTVGLHGPTHSRRWGAAGARVTHVDAPGEDAGFISLGFEYPPNPPDCMGRIEVDRVWSAVVPYIMPMASTSAAS